MIFVGGRKFVGKSRTKIFRAGLGEFGQKSFAPPKFACSYTYALLYSFVSIYDL